MVKRNPEKLEQLDLSFSKEMWRDWVILSSCLENTEAFNIVFCKENMTSSLEGGKDNAQFASVFLGADERDKKTIRVIMWSLVI